LQANSQLDGGVRDVLTVQGAINSRTTAGGTAPALVTAQIKAALAANAKTEKEITSRHAAFSEMMSA